MPYMPYTLESRLWQYKSIADANNVDWHVIAHIYMRHAPGIIALLSFSWFATAPHDNRFSVKAGA